MEHDLQTLSARARRAVQSGDWRTVSACSAGILRQHPRDPEGHFLAGLVERHAGRPLQAARAFEQALRLDPERYDAAVELASQYLSLGRHADSLRLLESSEPRLGNSPHYLDVAGTLYSRLGLHQRAGPLHERAHHLQPEVERFQANLAASCVVLGRLDEAIALYEALLQRFPKHQRYHHQLSGLRRARNETHLEQMIRLQRSNGLPPERNIFLYYAIGKELEDLERWDEAFEYYRKAGDAAAGAAHYDVGADLELIDRIIEVCDADWLGASAPPVAAPSDHRARPIFIVGLPRTGTTLTERILSSHSQVESAGESYFLQLAVQRSGGDGSGGMRAERIEAASRLDPGVVGRAYLEAVAYRLAGKPMFIEKFPENFLYLGFIARDLPQAFIVHLRRHPMDTCFAMYKQSFFRYAYTLEDLGRYYIAHDRLCRHWRAVLGERLIELDYEALARDPEGRTRWLLGQLGLEFEPACLEFERNAAPAATASAVQVREKVHTRSVGKWRHFARHLEPLRARLAAAGIELDGVQDVGGASAPIERRRG